MIRLMARRPRRSGPSTSTGGATPAGAFALMCVAWAVQAARTPIEPQLQDALRLAMTLAEDRTLATTLSPELDRWRDQLFAWHASRTATAQPILTKWESRG